MTATVLMMTCKKLEQCWEPFFTLFRKFWPDCPYELVMGTDQGIYPDVKTIEVGSDLGWTKNCLYVLNKIQTDRVIIFFEDFFPSAPFSSKKIEKLVQHSIDHNIACLRLQPCPGPSAPWPHDDSLGILQPRDKYRFSWQTAIWDRKFLLNFLLPHESPWETEVYGTKRASKIDRHFVSVKRGESPTPYYITGIVKGKWQEGAIKLLKDNGIDTSKITKIVK